MSRKSESLYQGITWIEDEIVEEAREEKTPRKKSRAPRWLALAACVCLVAGGVLVFRHSAAPPAGPSGMTGSRPTETEDGVVIPPREISLDDSQPADMVRFFVYRDRVYVQSELLPMDADVIGQRLGTVTGLIHEWTPEEGYVELAGSAEGDFYSVKGLDPEFMLCQRNSDGTIQLFVQDSGITLKRGADMLRDRLHLPERFAGLEYQTREEWNGSCGTGQRLKPELEGEALAFLEKLQEGSYVLRGDGKVWEQELHHVWLLQEGGVRTHLALFTDGTDGFVLDYGFPGVCLKVEKETVLDFDALLDREDSGIPVETETGPLTLEDCRRDPALGGYLPAYIPGNLVCTGASIRYDIDRETGAVGQTRQIHLELSDPDVSAIYGTVDVMSPDLDLEEEEDVPLLERQGLTVQQVEDHMEGPDLHGDVMEEDLNLGVRLGDVAVLLYAAGLSPEECFAILDSLPQAG